MRSFEAVKIGHWAVKHGTVKGVTSDSCQICLFECSQMVQLLL